MTYDEIKQAIARLSVDERKRLQVWLAELDAPPASQPEESTASRFGRIAGRAFSDVRKRIKEQ